MGKLDFIFKASIHIAPLTFACEMSELRAFATALPGISLKMESKLDLAKAG
jgi:hypothetical protein